MTSTIRIGVFAPLQTQFLDFATVDVLATISSDYLAYIPTIPTSLSSAAPTVTVSYITTPGSFPDIKLTAGATVRATHSYTDDAVKPGMLDVMIVPGPDPRSVCEEAALAWLKAHADTEGVDVLSVCTGIFICAAAGIAQGKLVSCTKGFEEMLEKEYPGVTVEKEGRRWVRSGNLWSSGGVTNGNDLMAEYARSSGRWPSRELVEMGLAITDVGDRSEFYESK